MTKLITFFALLFPLSSFCQNFIMTGTVYSYDLKETGKIFFTELGDKFKETQFVKYDKKKRFIFSMNLEKIKNIKILVFSTDTTSKSNDDNSCTQRIYINEIINSQEFSNKKNIKIYSDLELDLNCEEVPYYDAKKDEKQRFVGMYDLIKKDTLLKTKLVNILKQYHSTLSIKPLTLMSEEHGSWDFDIQKNKLFIYVSYQSNRKFGSLIHKNQIYEFDVKELKDTIIFSSKNYKLIKNEIVKPGKENPEEGIFIGDWETYNKKNLFQAQELIDMGIKGKVRILFYVKSDGEIQNIELDNKSEQKNQELVKMAKYLIKNSIGRWKVISKEGINISGWKYKDIIFED